MKRYLLAAAFLISVMTLSAQREKATITLKNNINIDVFQFGTINSNNGYLLIKGEYKGTVIEFRDSDLAALMAKDFKLADYRSGACLGTLTVIKQNGEEYFLGLASVLSAPHYPREAYNIVYTYKHPTTGEISERKVDIRNIDRINFRTYPSTVKKEPTASTVKKEPTASTGRSQDYSDFNTGTGKSKGKSGESKDKFWTPSNQESSNEKYTIGSLVDTRDNNTYQTVSYNGMTYMADNMKFIPQVYQVNDPGGIWVAGYDGNSVEAAKEYYSYKNFGCLYSYKVSENVCPEGWRLPNKSEMETLHLFLDESETPVNVKEAWFNCRSFQDFPKKFHSGAKGPEGNLLQFGEEALFWVIDNQKPIVCWHYYSDASGSPPGIDMDFEEIDSFEDYSTIVGLAVRCVKVDE